MTNLKKHNLILASNNPNKVKEINALLVNTNFNVVPQTDVDIMPIEETGLTFTDNALLKARNAAAYANCPVIADDSGLEVPALKNEPGIYSARYAGEGASDKDNLNKLISAIKSLKGDRYKARFVCSMVFLKAAADRSPIIAQGNWDGYVIAEPRGEYGFGYDSVFFLPEYLCTAAELAPKTKNQLSHRAQALRLLIKEIENYYDNNLLTINNS